MEVLFFREGRYVFMVVITSKKIVIFEIGVFDKNIHIFFFFHKFLNGNNKRTWVYISKRRIKFSSINYYLCKKKKKQTILNHFREKSIFIFCQKSFVKMVPMVPSPAVHLGLKIFWSKARKYMVLNLSWILTSIDFSYI